MATTISVASINKSTIISANSRYQNSDVIYYGSIPKITFTTYVRRSASQANTKVALITPGWEYRPDLVSYDLYNVPDFWWLIMEFNGIYDILNFKAGTTIQLPSVLTT